jgi:hypothetical protein
MRYLHGRLMPVGQWRRPDDTTYARFAKACRQAKGRNLVDEIFDPLRLLHEAGKAPPDVAAALAVFQPRPFYTAETLASLWPWIAIGLGGKSNSYRPKPEALRKRLVECKLPLLRKEGGSTWFEHKGKYREFLVVQDVAKWSRLEITQERFDEIMGEKP